MKRLKRMMHQCPLGVCILCGWAVVAMVRYVPSLRQQIGQTQTEAVDDREELSGYSAFGGAMAEGRVPGLSLEELAGGSFGEWADAQQGAQNGAKQADAQQGAGKDENTKGQPQPDGPEKEQPAGSDKKQPRTDGEKEENRDPEEQKPDEDRQKKISPEYISYEKKKTDSPYYSDPGKIPMTTKYDYVKVKDDYFDDAVFIGDSRMEGMEDYSGLDNATFFAKPGLTVFDLLDDKFIKDPDSGKKVSVSDMLKRHTYGKIYLMVGINELGTGGTERFAKSYEDVLKKIRKWQPDAVIYVHSIMGVSPAKDKSDKVFNNTNIRDKNYAISKLTDGIHIFYFNIQQLYEDKNHNLAQDLTFDDVHLYAKHYSKWVDYLREHAVEVKKK